jgi:hypothetical protein
MAARSSTYATKFIRVVSSAFLAIVNVTLSTKASYSQSAISVPLPSSQPASDDTLVKVFPSSYGKPAQAPSLGILPSVAKDSATTLSDHMLDKAANHINSSNIFASVSNGGEIRSMVGGVVKHAGIPFEAGLDFYETKNEWHDTVPAIGHATATVSLSLAAGSLCPETAGVGCALAVGVVAVPIAGKAINLGWHYIDDHAPQIRAGVTNLVSNVTANVVANVARSIGQPDAVKRALTREQQNQWAKDAANKYTKTPKYNQSAWNIGEAVFLGIGQNLLQSAIGNQGYIGKAKSSSNNNQSDCSYQAQMARKAQNPGSVNYMCPDPY